MGNIFFGRRRLLQIFCRLKECYLQVPRWEIPVLSWGSSPPKQEQPEKLMSHMKHTLWSSTSPTKFLQMERMSTSGSSLRDSGVGGLNVIAAKAAAASEKLMSRMKLKPIWYDMMFTLYWVFALAREKQRWVILQVSGSERVGIRLPFQVVVDTLYSNWFIQVEQETLAHLSWKMVLPRPTYSCPDCLRKCTSSSGLTRHRNILHRELTPALDEEGDETGENFTYHRHPYLTGKVVIFCVSYSNS